MPKRQLTEAAQVAKFIRQHLRRNGIKATVRSSNFSMGSLVTVKVTDLLPATLEAVKEYCSQYEYGHFDGMQDLYISSNRRPDIPQTKYLTIECEYSQVIKQKAWDYLRTKLGRLEGAPSSHTEASRFYDNHGDCGDVLLWRALQGKFGQDFGFWATQKPRVRVKA